MEAFATAQHQVVIWIRVRVAVSQMNKWPSWMRLFSYKPFSLLSQLQFGQLAPYIKKPDNISMWFNAAGQPVLSPLRRLQLSIEVFALPALWLALASSKAD